MKKLVTAACALVAASAFAVESANTVGYYDIIGDGAYHVFTPGVQKIGGGTTLMSDIMGTASAYSVEMQEYDPDAGEWISWYWDGTGWTDFSDTVDLEFPSGHGYFCMFTEDCTAAGEIAGTVNASGKFTYDHSIPSQEYFVFGSAFPVPLTTSNFNLGAVFSAFGAEIQVYDPDAGEWISWYWDGTGWTDFNEYLPDQITAAGEGVFFYSYAESTVTLTETLQ